MKQVFITKLRIGGLIFFTTFILFIKSVPVLFLLSLALFIFSLFFDKNHKLSGRIYSLLIVTIFILLFQLIFNTSVDFAGRVTLGVIAAAKIFSLSMLVFFFTSVTSIKQITDALSFLPGKIQLMIIITFSMIPSIFEESQKILMVQNSRGHNSKSLNIAKSLIPFIIPLLHRTLKRAEQISISMESRGYDEG